jgi:hypothetical protein
MKLGAFGFDPLSTLFLSPFQCEHHLVLRLAFLWRNSLLIDVLRDPGIGMPQVS